MTGQTAAAVPPLDDRTGAVAQLAATAVALGSVGSGMTLGVHGLDRQTFDAFDGVETYYPIVEGEEGRSHEWWHRKVILHGVAAESVVVDLYTTEPPADEEVV